jgi:hypothetical protein
MANDHDGGPGHKHVFGANPTTALSLTANKVATLIDNLLSSIAGEHIPFLLVFQSDHVAQYIGNVDREDAIKLMESLIARWREGMGDIKAHENPETVDPTKPGEKP